MKKTKADLEDGYTRIANSLLEQLINYPFTMREYRVMLFIIRQTYGYNRKAHEMSYSFIADGTGISRNKVIEIIKDLEKKYIVKRTPQSGRKPQELQVNSKLSEWNCTPKESTPKKGTPKRGTELYPKMGAELYPKMGYQINTDKEIQIKERQCCGSSTAAAQPFEIFERLWNEWEYSKLGKEHISRKQRAEIENIGYLRMSDARWRYELEHRSKTTQNNQPLSARTWFSEAYKYYLPTVDENGFWTDSEGKEYKHTNGKDVLIE